MRPHSARLSALAFALPALLALSACNRSKEDPWQGQRGPSPVPVSAPDLILQPESERFLDSYIMGLDPFNDGFFRVPLLDKNPGLPAAEFRELQKRLYTLNFELTHGAVLRLLPTNAELYVAQPQGKTAGPRGIEKEAFIDYLRQRCGWDKGDLAERLRFFPSQYPLVWLQDAGEILGSDRQGRLVIRIDSFGNPQYHENIRSLVASYPDRFQLLVTHQGVSAEGGDEEMVWLPDGRLGMLAGRNRAVQYVRIMHDPDFEPQGMTREMAEEARSAFSATYNNLPVLFVPWTVLLNPALGNPEIFHMDMVLCVMDNESGHHAFVPTYGPHPADSNFFKALEPDFVKACQSEYDQVAEEMTGLGYQVGRLPFSDHPVRSPANVLKYVDRATKHSTVMLARYPWHLPLTDMSSPARRLDNALQELAGAIATLQESPVAANEQAVLESLSRVWIAMDASVRAPNPDYDRQAAVFRAAGMDVVGVPIYPGGSGGLHCMALR